MATTKTTSSLSESILRWDEMNIAYFGECRAVPGMTICRAERADAPDFDVAMIYAVPVAAADATLETVVSRFRGRGRTPRVRLGPGSRPRDWPRRLATAGFVETTERLRFFVVPPTARLFSHPAVRVERVVSPRDGTRFAAVQAEGFDLPREHRQWERELVQRRLMDDVYQFYLASRDGRVVGAARSARVARVATGLAALTTLREARGRGVATSLLARMIDDARGAGSRTIFGATVPGSDAARLYERLGFVSIFETRTFVLPG